MIAFVLTLLFIALGMWGFFKFMYPKPPKAFMPQEGDIVTPRECDFCGYPLAQYRGVLEQKPQSALTATEMAKLRQYHATQTIAKDDSQQSADSATDLSTQTGLSRRQKKDRRQAQHDEQQAAAQQQYAIDKMCTWFFCNYEHQAQFHNQLANQASPRKSNQQDKQQVKQTGSQAGNEVTNHPSRQRTTKQAGNQASSHSTKLPSK